MLILTETHLYTMGPTGLADEPTIRLVADGLQSAVEGRGFEAVALADGRVMLIRGEQAVELAAGLPGADKVTSLLVPDPDRPVVLAGTEPPHMFRLAEGAEPQRLEGFESLADRANWFTPWGGPPAVRSLARGPEAWIFADVHVGGVHHSRDGGESWASGLEGLEYDVHQVASCPAEPDRVYANTAKGVYISFDRGLSWHGRADDLGHRYGRAVAVHPLDGDCLLASVSDGPHGENVHGQLFRSDDAGQTWQPVEGDFPPSTLANIDTYHVAFTADGVAWACVDQELFIGSEKGRLWEPVWAAPEPIRRILPRGF